MGTGSRVGIIRDKKIYSTSVHFDGNLDGVGITLLRHFNSDDKVGELISKGDIRSINGVDVDYYCEEKGSCDVDDDFVQFINRAQREYSEYYYLIVFNNWYCGDMYGTTPISGKLVHLENAFEIMKNNENDDDDESQ